MEKLVLTVKKDDRVSQLIFTIQSSRELTLAQQSAIARSHNFTVESHAFLKEPFTHRKRGHISSSLFHR